MNQIKLSRIELFAFDSPPSFLYGAEQADPCNYGVLKLTCGNQSGFGVCILSKDALAVDLIKWGSFLTDIRHHTLEEAFEIVRYKGLIWSTNQHELVKMALLELFEVKYLQYKIAAGAEFRGYDYRSQVMKSRPKSLIHNRKNYDITSENLIDESSSYFSLL